MNPIVRNVLVVIAGIIVGSLVNISIVSISGSVIPPPEGADITTMEGLKASMHLFGPKNFIMPFLAHALGTLAAAWVAAQLAVSHHLRIALIIGLFFLIGGISAVMMLPAPMWFNMTDLLLAYIPMAFLGWKLAGGK